MYIRNHRWCLQGACNAELTVPTTPELQQIPWTIVCRIYNEFHEILS